MQLLLLPIYALAQVQRLLSRPSLRAADPATEPPPPLDETGSAETGLAIQSASDLVLCEVLDAAIALRQPTTPEFLGPLHWNQPIRFFVQVRDFWQRRWQRSQAALTGSKVRGIATRLADRLLILVDELNRPIELQPDQRQRLQQRIVWELSHLGQQQRLARNGSPLAQGQPPPALVPRGQQPWWQRFLTWWSTLPARCSGQLAPSPAPSLSAKQPIASLPVTTIPGRLLRGLLHWPRRHAAPALPIAALPLLPSPALAGADLLHPNNDPQAALISQASPQDYRISEPAAAAPRNRVIETHVKATSYEQTWWQQIVDWLDRTIAWVEQRLIELWQTFINS
jgi:hypothetical protein